MALKSVIDSLDDADESVRDHYKQESDGKFYLETDKGSVRGLIAARDHEKNLRVNAEAKLAPLETQIGELNGQIETLTTERDDARRKKTGMDDALEQSYKDKIAKIEGDRDALVGELNGEINRLLVSDTAQRMAAEISTVPDLIAPVIEARLAAEKGADGKFFLRVLDGEKKPSAASLDDFKQELLANTKYAAILVGGKGSGGSANDSGDKGSAPSKKGYWDHSDEELKTLRTEQPEEYERLRKEASSPAPAL
jgi:hypothetical protein